MDCGSSNTVIVSNIMLPPLTENAYPFMLLTFRMSMYVIRYLFFLLGTLVVSRYSSFEVGVVGLAPARLSLLSPRGIRFEIDGKMSFILFHRSVCI